MLQRRLAQAGTLALAMFACGFAVIAVTRWTRSAPPSKLSAVDFYNLALSGNRVGPGDAPSVAVVFIDYGCGWCADFEVAVEAALARYPRHLAVVFKHFLPVEGSASAVIAMAAECAEDQGKFNDFHRAVFTYPNVAVRREGWRELGDSVHISDPHEFVRCVLSERKLIALRRDTEEGRRLGVVGTPTSFVNRVRFAGAVSPSAFDSAVGIGIRPAGGKRRGR